MFSRGMGRKTGLFDNNDPSTSADDSTITRVYDSLGRILEENQDGNLVSYGYESFVDGALVAESLGDGLSGSSGRILVGCRRTMAAGQFWSGLIDDVRIYNRAVKP